MKNSNKFKAIILLLIVACMCLAISACGLFDVEKVENSSNTGKNPVSSIEDNDGSQDHGTNSSTGGTSSQGNTNSSKDDNTNSSKEETSSSKEENSSTGGGAVAPTPTPVPEEYEFTFEPNGGSIVASVKAEKLTSLPACTKDGYKFVGWYDNESLSGNAIIVPYAPNANVTLYAKWEKESTVDPTPDREFKSYINISDYSNSVGEVTSDKVNGVWTIQAGTVDIRSRSRTWTKTGYADYNNIDTKTTLDGKTELKFTHSIRLAADTGLKVNVPSKGYLALYVQNGSSTATSQAIKVNGVSYAIPLNEVVQVVVAVEKGEYVVTKTDTTVDLFYAELYCDGNGGGTIDPAPTPTEYTFTFEPNGGSNVESITAEKLTTLPTCTKDGYKFLGWYDNESLSGNPITAPYAPNANITLYAKWEAIPEPVKEYVFTFETNGGSNVESITAEKLTSLPTCTKDGYKFVGWFDNESLSGNPITVPYAPNANVTLYAKWEKESTVDPIPTQEYKSYINISDYSKFTGTLTNDIVSDIWTIQAGTVDIRSRSRTWTKASYSGYNYIDTKTTLDGKTTLTFTHSIRLAVETGLKVNVPSKGYLALYVQNGSSTATSQAIKVNGVSYAIPTNDLNSPVVQVVVAVEKGEYVVTKTDTTVDLYYAELYCDGNGGGTIDPTPTPTEYTFTFEPNGGSYVESVTAEKLTSLPACTKDGYKFLGWFDNQDFAGNPITVPYAPNKNVTLYAKWETLTPSDAEYLVEVKGLSETAYVVWKDTKATYARAYYKKTDATNYTLVDSELIRDIGGGQARVDILGLSAGTYDIKIAVGSAGQEFVCENITVNSYDRSGYAHFGYTKGVGAYNDDGTLKSNVKVVYITEETKNTTGVVKALQSGNVCVRIIGRVTTDTRKSASSWEGKYTKIDGLREGSNSGEGTLWGLCEVQKVSNITFEGVGVDAEIYQWGVSFKRCNSVEVRNLTFTNYPEDACEFNGGSNDEMPNYGNYWVHNNVFNQGMRLFDDSDDQDKAEGDGAIDLKYCHNATYSYNKVANCHKTGLIGGSDSSEQKNITFHHNYFYKNSSRMPLGRQANMHYYNNYYESISGTCMSIRGNGYVFAEGNYFYKCKNPFEVKTGGVIKSYNNVLSGCSGTQSEQEVTDRTKAVSNNCAFGSTFDTDSKNFYYDSSKKVSDVRYLTSADQAKKDCVELAGVGKANK